MTTTTTRAASGPDLSADGRQLVAEIERYLTTTAAAAAPAAVARATAHPLLTKTTAELVGEALSALDDRPVPPPAAPAPAADLRLPGAMWRALPDWTLAVLRPLQRGAGVDRLSISPAAHLDLTALVLERWGWGQTGHAVRSRAGRRCILGAQAVLVRLGYGTEHTVAAAAAHLDGVLRARGIRDTYWRWNEHRNVGQDQALALVREAANAARGTGR